MNNRAYHVTSCYRPDYKHVLYTNAVCVRHGNLITFSGAITLWSASANVFIHVLYDNIHIHRYRPTAEMLILISGLKGEWGMRSYRLYKRSTSLLLCLNHFCMMNYSLALYNNKINAIPY